MISNVNGYKTKQEWFIDKGSFGSVYKAEKDGKIYAIKVFRSELLKTEYRKRMDREVRAMQKITHQNVVKLHDFGTFKENEFEYFYIVMDYVSGKTLSDFNGVIGEKDCIELIKSVLTTLKAVHDKGIIHRDLTPGNIKINDEGTPILLDFGLSKLIDYSSITQTGERVGTYNYMSPEQVTDSKNIDERSDFFSIGIILYELLTGETPYDAANLPALINQIKDHYPKIPSELNPDISNAVENTILKLLEKEPYKRFQEVSEVISALQSNAVKVGSLLDLSEKYFIRLMHNEKTLFSKGVEEGLIKNVVYPSNFFKRFHPTLKVIQDSGVRFVTDPATNRLSYTVFSKTEGLRELPYSSDDEVRPIRKSDFDSISQVQEYVKKVVDFQIENGVSEITAPYFYARNSDDDFFGINIKLLRESVEYRNKKYKDTPMWGGICMNVDMWHEDDEKNKILNAYVRASPDGFFVYGDPIGNTSNLTQLFHYADLLKKLQETTSSPVVACRVNGIGALLLAIGLSGFSSGISSLDSFNESIISDAKGDFGVAPRYYIPEMMSMVSLPKGVTTKLIDISNSSIGSDVSCSCKYCGSIGKGALTSENIKLHYLLSKKKEVDEIKKIDKKDRLSYVEERIEKAIKYKNTLGREKIKIGNLSHLNTWNDLVKIFKKRDF